MKTMLGLQHLLLHCIYIVYLHTIDLTKMFVDDVVSLLKIKKSNLPFIKVFIPLLQYFVKSPLATITQSLDLGSLYHSSCQIIPSYIRLGGKCLWTAIFGSPHRCLMGFKSGLWLGQSRTVRVLSWSYSSVSSGVCFQVTIVLKGEPSHALQGQNFFMNFSVFATFILHQFWLDSLSLLLRSCPIACCCHHHASL